MGLTSTLVSNIERLRNNSIENRILGASYDTHPMILAINAELLLRILGLKDDANYLLHPKQLVKLAIKTIQGLEKNRERKEICADLLEQLD